MDAYTPVRDRGVDDLSPTEDLFHVVDVGEPSERETRRLFREAEESVYVLTKSFGYIDAVRPAMRDAIEHGVDVDVLLLAPEHLSEKNKRRQDEIRTLLAEEFPPVSVRISDRVLPWRGTFIDPSLEYDSGQGLLMVEQEEIRTTTARQRSRRTRRSWPDSGSTSISFGDTRADPERSSSTRSDPCTVSRANQKAFSLSYSMSE